MECVQVGLALQLDSSAQGCHWAAPKPFCHAAYLAAQLQHLLHFTHLHLVVGFCPAAQQGKGEGGLRHVMLVSESTLQSAVSDAATRRDLSRGPCQQLLLMLFFQNTTQSLHAEEQTSSTRCVS